jgi:hypothetical protein
VFLLEWDGEAVDDRPQNLQQLRHTLQVKRHREEAFFLGKLENEKGLLIAETKGTRRWTRLTHTRSSAFSSEDGWNEMCVVACYKTVRCVPVMPLGLVDESVEDVGDGLADEGPVAHELAVDAVQDRLEVVPLTGVLSRHKKRGETQKK